jgi:5-methylcytosine-specific restriction endonuclease McrA
MHDVLLLNADARPVSFLPLSAENWQNAMIRLYKKEAEVLHEYENWDIHSPGKIWKVPSVIILKQQVKKMRSWVARDESAQKNLVFLRDMFVCQYCNQQFPRKTLTLDHVKPRFHGGRTKWTNLVSACSSCNTKKGHDLSVKPLKLPEKPTYGDLIKNMKKFPITIPHKSWNYYLGWNEELIRLINPKTVKTNMHDIFDLGLEWRQP